jgi:demethylmenaquinone methyltransferase/2-methoxy-6-polyprenyl-1,4-benzoquinol methylase
MAQTYGLVNLVSSFGFSHAWRRVCVAAVLPVARRRCADLMCGRGEAATLLAATAPAAVECFDFCPEMVRRASRQVVRGKLTGVHVVERDVLSLPREPLYDRMVCSFGLKTLDDAQLVTLAEIVAACLTPGGIAGFVEISVPQFAPLRAVYLGYLRYVIPAIGWLFLGHPACYRWLARYTEDFARRDRFAAQLRSTGLIVTERPLFLGCARLYRARKPDTDEEALAAQAAQEDFMAT